MSGQGRGELARWDHGLSRLHRLRFDALLNDLDRLDLFVGLGLDIVLVLGDLDSYRWLGGRRGGFEFQLSVGGFAAQGLDSLIDAEQG